ncbi:MAG: SEC-C domain-containing protein [Endozoicomonadaceae bacterium]|nr:SEC-C domain-containing protein [Endozoicomonadaceae bacterium]
MSKFFYKGSRFSMQDNRSTGYTPKKVIRIGTGTSPARISVQTEEREKELLTLAKAHSVVVDIVVAEDEPEDTCQLDALINKATTQVNEKIPSRNDPCLCSSGKKYKKCCGA